MASRWALYQFVLTCNSCTIMGAIIVAPIKPLTLGRYKHESFVTRKIMCKIESLSPWDEGNRSVHNQRP